MSESPPNFSSTDAVSVRSTIASIGEAMVLLTLTAAVLEKFGGDSLVEVQDNLARYLERITRLPAPDDADGDVRPVAPADAGSGAAGSGGDD